MSEQTTNQARVNALYLAFFGRPADPAGLAYWTQVLDADAGAERLIAQAFANSPEAQARFGGDTTEQRITDIYQQLFNRAPEAAGLAYWMGVVEQGHTSLAEAALAILNGAQGADARLATTRQQVASNFTATVDASGSNYHGDGALQAARALLHAVNAELSQPDLARMVQASATLADLASRYPAVIDAFTLGGSLQALFDSPRGVADPVNLLQLMADLAQFSGGDPARLDALLLGAGLSHMLDAMPAHVTLQDLLAALASGGLQGAIDVVYPAPLPAPPPPAPPPVSSLSLERVESGPGDRNLEDRITHLDSADVTFRYDGEVQDGQRFEYTIDGGVHWISTGMDTSVSGIVLIADLDLTGGTPLPPAGDPIPDVVTTLQLRLVDANGAALLSTTAPLTLDRYAAVPTVALVNPTAQYFDGFSHGNTSVARFEITDLEPGAIAQYQIVVPGANAPTWVDTMPTLVDGLHTVKVRQLDAAGNASDAREMRFSLNTELPGKLTLRLAADTGVSDQDGITNNGTVLIEGLGAPWLTGWEYSLDGGTTWIFGGIKMDGITPELDLSQLNVATGSLVVRQINYAGNASAASDALAFTYDATAPTEALSFVRISGEADGVRETEQSAVDLTFAVTGKDDGIIQWRVQGSAQWNSTITDNGDGTFTIAGIDLSRNDPTIELQVIDPAGNIGFTDSVRLYGPFGIEVQMTPQGLRVKSSAAGTIEIGGVAVTPTGATGAIVGTVLVGQQEFERSGVLTVRTADGRVLTDPSGRIYQLGSAQPDGLQGSYLWGFGGGDSIEGTSGDNYISGGAGNDSIYSRGGSDIISGGAGTDLIELVVDGKGSTLVYAPGDTRQGVVVSGDYFNGTDFIFGAEAGDMVQVGAIFTSTPSVSDTLLTSAAANQVALVRASGDSRITVNPEGTSFLLQWADGTTINSIYFHNYAGADMALVIDAAKGTMTLTNAPVLSSYTGTTFRFTATDSAFKITGSPHGMVHAGTSNGLLAGASVTLFNTYTNALAPASYTSGAGFGIDADGWMHFGSPVAAGVYRLIYNDTTFATDSGRLAAADVLFAGGAAGHIVHQGFTIVSTTGVTPGSLDPSASTLSLQYLPGIGTGGSRIELTTGARPDVVRLADASFAVQYQTFTAGAQDLLFGFGADDSIALLGSAATALDQNADGQITWAGNILVAGDEAMVVELSSALVTADLDDAASATAQFWHSLDVSALGNNGKLLILARDSAANSAALLYYQGTDNNATIDAGELTLVATFVDGVPLEQQIELIGNPPSP